jgi:hypothetical protein
MEKQVAPAAPTPFAILIILLGIASAAVILWGTLLRPEAPKTPAPISYPVTGCIGDGTSKFPLMCPHYDRSDAISGEHDVLFLDGTIARSKDGSLECFCGARRSEKGSLIVVRGCEKEDLVACTCGGLLRVRQQEMFDLAREGCAASQPAQREDR